MRWLALHCAQIRWHGGDFFRKQVGNAPEEVQTVEVGGTIGFPLWRGDQCFHRRRGVDGEGSDVLDLES